MVFGESFVILGFVRKSFFYHFLLLEFNVQHTWQRQIFGWKLPKVKDSNEDSCVFVCVLKHFCLYFIKNRLQKYSLTVVELNNQESVFARQHLPTHRFSLSRSLPFHFPMHSIISWGLEYFKIEHEWCDITEPSRENTSHT